MDVLLRGCWTDISSKRENIVMAKIECKVVKCSHNKAGVCHANCVEIVGSSAKRDYDTACKSYLNKIHYSELTANKYSEGSCDCLTCSVESCSYNDNNRLCTLGNIKVDGEAAEYYTHTSCSSFQREK